MPTTIKSSELDFFEIKKSLKLFLEQQDEFEDYDFEGSALSNILDVLAYNTHFNGLIANFALNESYLTTAQMRNSVVSLAESLGYIPGSFSSAQSTVSVSVDMSGIGELEQVYSFLPGELRLEGSIDGQGYTFTNRETITADAGGTAVYDFYPHDDPSAAIKVFEGESRTQQYLVDGTPNEVYVIPDEKIDTATVIVKVYEDQSSAATGQGAYAVYNNVFEAATIDATSRLYILRESPNKFFELTFGDNNSLGVTPVAGNVIEINYLRTKGTDANNVGNMKLDKSLKFGDLDVSGNTTIVTETRSAGGGTKEDIESIRKRAPFQYAAQNRMITPLDYEALILRKFANYITDIICWGGEDDYRRDYGSVYTSIVWDDDLSSTTVGQLRDEVRAMTKQLSVVSFALKFVAASETYISTTTHYQYNPVLSANSESVVNSMVNKEITEYMSDNIGQFQKTFRRSQMLTRIDDVDPSILSSRSSTLLQKRIMPILTLRENHEMTFPSALKVPSDIEVPVVKSSIFVYDNKNVYIRNKLQDRVKISPDGVTPIVYEIFPSTTLEMVDVNGVEVVSNIGSYEPTTGIVKIEGLVVQGILSANNYIKVFATPANESVVNAYFNNVLKFDESESVVQAVTVTARN